MKSKTMLRYVNDWNVELVFSYQQTIIYLLYDSASHVTVINSYGLTTSPFMFQVMMFTQNNFSNKTTQKLHF